MPLFFIGGNLLKKYLMVFLTIVVGAFVAIVFNQGEVKAAATASQINYSISPELPDNQVAQNIGYYDLKVDPNQKQTIKFKINNYDTTDHTYMVSVNRATTDFNGIIDYSAHGVTPGNDLRYNIEDLVTYPHEVSVSAKSSKEVSINLNAPKGNFDGVLLGGIFVEENNQVSQAKATKGISLRNRYSYVLGLQLQQNTDPVRPDLKFVSAYQNDVNGQIAVNAVLDNDVPTLERKVSVDARVTPANSKKVVLKLSKQNMTFAPDSKFSLPIDVNNTTGPNKNKRLKPGKYTVYVKVLANDRKNSWNLKRDFTITARQANKINHKTPNRSMDVWIILGLILILVAIGVIVIIYYRRRRKNK